ncbi:MAG: hypothetical protein WBB19_12925 [Desulforhopalus sp.]
MATALHKQIIDRPTGISCLSLFGLIEQVSEWFWFLLSFVLFVVLGPFSAPIVLIALIKLGLEENDHPEPEPISSH